MRLDGRTMAPHHQENKQFFTERGTKPLIGYRVFSFITIISAVKRV
jgi:hypothetical protein